MLKEWWKKATVFEVHKHAHDHWKIDGTVRITTTAYKMKRSAPMSRILLNTLLVSAIWIGVL